MIGKIRANTNRAKNTRKIKIRKIRNSVIVLSAVMVLLNGIDYCMAHEITEPEAEEERVIEDTAVSEISSDAAAAAVSASEDEIDNVKPSQDISNVLSDNSYYGIIEDKEKESDEPSASGIKEEILYSSGSTDTENVVSANAPGVSAEFDDDGLPVEFIPHYDKEYKHPQWSIDCSAVAMARAMEQTYYYKYGEDINIDLALAEVRGIKGGITTGIDPYEFLFAAGRRCLWHANSNCYSVHLNTPEQ